MIPADQPLRIKVTVNTNGSLTALIDVSEDLAKAVWISLKLDSTREEVWRMMNRLKPTLTHNSRPDLKFGKRGDITPRTLGLPT
jgi:wyosine [tRNA(Phe)-imidazoG37] synthetase (radical SAM superfamily)